MNKGELRTHFKTLLNKTNVTDAIADSYIDASLRYLESRLRIKPMEYLDSYTVPSVGYAGYPIPSDYLQRINLYLEDAYPNGRKLTYMPFEEFHYRYDEGSGVPRYYNRQGEFFILKDVPAADKVLKLRYYRKFTPMVFDTDTNEISDIAPDLIVFRAMAFASTVFKDIRKNDVTAVADGLEVDLQSLYDLDEVSGADMAQTPLSGDY